MTTKNERHLIESHRIGCVLCGVETNSRLECVLKWPSSMEDGRVLEQRHNMPVHNEPPVIKPTPLVTRSCFFIILWQKHHTLMKHCVVYHKYGRFIVILVQKFFLPNFLN